MQKSKNGLYTENIGDKYIITIYISLVIYVTLAILTKKVYPS